MVRPLPAGARDALALLCAALFSSASPASAADAVDVDPFADDAQRSLEAGRDLSTLDRVNRGNMRINDWLLVHVYDGAARGYNVVMPKWGQRRLANLIGNLAGPRDVVNSLLQAKLRRSGVHLARFTVDSTVGIAGMFEVAGPLLGMRAAPETFNETLGVYHVGAGPFLILPLLGETSARGLVGTTVDAFLHPLSWVPPPGVATTASLSTRAVEGVGGLSLRMPEARADERRWTTYENLRAAATAVPYMERKELFITNQSWDVEE